LAAAGTGLWYRWLGAEAYALKTNRGEVSEAKLKSRPGNDIIVEPYTAPLERAREDALMIQVYHWPT